MNTNTNHTPDLFLFFLLLILTEIISFLIIFFIYCNFETYNFLFSLNSVLIFLNANKVVSYFYSFSSFYDDDKINLIIKYSFYISSLFSVFITLYIYSKLFKVENEIQIAGRKLLKHDEAIKAFKKQTKMDFGNSGLTLIKAKNDNLKITEDRETKHILISGDSGSGKSVVLRSYIDEAINRDDKVLILDNKAQFTQQISEDFILIAPWDSRGAMWDVATDIKTRSDAKAFASAIIEVSEKDPIWGNAARAVLESIIVRAQTESESWNFTYIKDIFKLGDDELQRTVQTYTPEFSGLVADMASKTTQSIMINLLSFIKPIFSLADAESENENTKFSFKEWLLNDETSDRIVIIQGHGGHSELQKGLTQAIFSFITQTVTSPFFTDVSPDARRICFFCDEFVQFGKIEGFGSLVEVGRSKGIRLVVVIQDKSQLQKIYGKETTQTWLGSLGTYVICRTTEYETADYFSKMIGMKRVKTYQPSFSTATESGAGGSSRTTQWQEQELPVVRTDELGQLGITKDGAEVIVFSSDENVFLVRARFPDAFQTEPKRAACIAAAWTL